MKLTDIKDAILEANKNLNVSDSPFGDEGPHYAMIPFTGEDDDGRKMCDGRIHVVLKSASQIEILIQWPLPNRKLQTGDLQGTVLRVHAATGQAEVETITQP
jgi:hypothetical protein